MCRYACIITLCIHWWLFFFFFIMFFFFPLHLSIYKIRIWYTQIPIIHEPIVINIAICIIIIIISLNNNTGSNTHTLTHSFISKLCVRMNRYCIHRISSIVVVVSLSSSLSLIFFFFFVFILFKNKIKWNKNNIINTRALPLHSFHTVSSIPIFFRNVLLFLFVFLTCSDLKFSFFRLSVLQIYVQKNPFERKAC